MVFLLQGVTLADVRPFAPAADTTCNCRREEHRCWVLVRCLDADSMLYTSDDVSTAMSDGLCCVQGQDNGVTRADQRVRSLVNGGHVDAI